MSTEPSSSACMHSVPLAQSWVPMKISTSIAPFERDSTKSLNTTSPS